MGARWLRDRTAPSEIAVLVRMNAQLAPIEAVLTRAGIAYQVRGIRFFDQADVRGAIDLVQGADLEATGTALTAAVRALWADRLGYDDDSVAGHAGEEARERTAALDTLLDILATLSRSDARVGAAGFLADLDRRRAAERAGSADGVNLLTYHRAKGLEWDAVVLPALEEGSCRSARPSMMTSCSPRSCGSSTSASRGRVATWRSHGPPSARPVGARLAESPAGSSPTCVPGRCTGRAGSPSTPIVSPRTRERRAASSASAASGYGVADDNPLYAALREWRTVRAREDGVPAYVVFHDQTLAAIAEMKPPSAAALRRVKGVGPAKIEAYGDEVLELVSRLR